MGFKAPSPICVTEEGISIEVREVHPAKAPSPICVTDEGISTEVREVHPAKAYAPICVYPLHNIKESIFRSVIRHHRFYINKMRRGPGPLRQKL